MLIEMKYQIQLSDVGQSQAQLAGRIALLIQLSILLAITKSLQA
jgi:hypothetical protein